MSGAGAKRSKPATGQAPTGTRAPFSPHPKAAAGPPVATRQFAAALAPSA